MYICRSYIYIYIYISYGMVILRVLGCCCSRHELEATAVGRVCVCVCVCVCCRQCRRFQRDRSAWRRFRRVQKARQFIKGQLRSVSCDAYFECTTGSCQQYISQQCSVQSISQGRLSWVKCHPASLKTSGTGFLPPDQQGRGAAEEAHADQRDLNCKGILRHRSFCTCLTSGR